MSRDLVAAEAYLRDAVARGADHAILERLALMELAFDRLRPLPAPISSLNRALVASVAASPYVPDGEKNERAWEQRFAQALASR